MKTRGYQPHQPDDLDNFILANYLRLSDTQMSIKVGVKRSNIAYRRYEKMGLVRPKDRFRLNSNHPYAA